MTKKTKALLVGINDYSPVGRGGADLSGCLNDVDDMKAVLIAFGFADDKITVLKDAEASRANILLELERLVADNAAGDAIVFYYSGHGSHQLDRGDRDEVFDEGICPYESLAFISDDTLRELFKPLQPGVSFDVFLDCCFSGTGTERRKRDRHGRILTFRFRPLILSTKRSASKRLTSSSRIVVSEEKTHTLWTACGENETSAETPIDGRMCGIFTHHLSRLLLASPHNVLRQDLATQVEAAVRDAGFVQVPQLETNSQNRGKAIFT